MAARKIVVSIRTKLALMFAGLAFATVGLGGVIALRETGDALEREILLRYEVAARSEAQLLQSHLRLLIQRCEDALATAATPTIEPESGASGRPRSAPGECDGMPFVQAELMSAGSGAFTDVALVVNGQVQQAVVGRIPHTFAQSLTGRDGVVVSGFLADGTGEHRGFGIAVPVPGEGAGHCVAWADASILSAADSRGVPADESADATALTMVLTDASGEPFARFVDQAWSAAETHPNPALPSTGAHWRRSLPVGPGGWNLEAAVDLDGPVSAVAALQSRIVGLGTLLIIGACLVFLLPLRFLARPLTVLTTTAKRIEGGDYSARAELDATDELGDLGRTFDAMAEAVQESAEGLVANARILRERQQDLSQERDRLQAVISSMRDGLIVLDSAGVPVLHNRAAEPLVRQLSAPGGHLIPHLQCEAADADPGACHSCFFDPARPPRSCQFEIEGGVFEIHATRLSADANGRSGRVLVIHDLSERISQDESHIHQERLAVLGEVAAVMAHELNNPLAAIKMYTQLSASTLESVESGLNGARADLTENVRVIQRNVDTCKRAIRQMLDYATGSTPEICQVDVLATLQDVAAFTRPLRQRADVKLDIDVEGDELLAHGDEVQIRQVFVNLVVNASQAMAETGGHIRMHAKRDGGHVLVTVSDDGPGIPSELQGDVFRPFFTTKGRGLGTGLGLSTARRIAEMHGGGVALEHSDADGTAFLVRIQAFSS